MSSDAAIRTCGLGKSYRTYEHPADRLVELIFPSRRRGTDFWALRDIDLTLRAGEAVGIVGRNGSGKSTLLQLICGLSQPSAGGIAVRGRVAGLLELGAGFNPDFTGRENAQLTAAILGLSKDEIAARFDAIEAFAGIGEFIDRPVHEYSSGMYARLAFSVCAHVDADILVIDEILAVGDAAFQQKCMRHLRQFKAGGGTLLFVSHSEESVLALCERAIWLERGVLQADGPSGEVCRRYASALQDRGGAFQAGGRAQPIKEPPPRDAPARLPGTTMPAELFDFDPDLVTETSDAIIERADFFDADGMHMTAAEVGEKIELCIHCVAKADLEDVVIAFIVRNRLGQTVFSDDTGLVDRNPHRRIKSGQPFSAKFLFHLPFLLTGEYSVETFVFDGAAAPHRLLARAVDAHFLTVHSRHVGGGLANIPVIAASLETKVNAGAKTDAL